MRLPRFGRIRHPVRAVKTLGGVGIIIVVFTLLLSGEEDDAFRTDRDLDSDEYEDKSWTSTSSNGSADDSGEMEDVVSRPSVEGIIIYNRVPKCASTTTRMVLHEVSSRNRLNVHVSKIYAQEYLNETGQAVFVRHLITIKKPVLFVRHLFFVDFTKFELTQPMYINMIRDPLDRLVSDYYFKRFNLRHMFPMSSEKRSRTYNECVQRNFSECTKDGPGGYFRVIPYFCGMDKRCLTPTNWALDKAKRNVEKYFKVVGTVEQNVSAFLEVLEKTMPQYFKGAVRIYTAGGERFQKMARTNKKDPLEEQTINIMREKLRYDYDFYHFVKKRFGDQYRELVGFDLKEGT